MNETIVCAVGNVATQPVYRETPSGPSARFRLAVTSRYWDREKNTWADGHTNFFTVWANRQLATNTAASLSVGDPVVVQGRLKVRTEVREGQSRTSADLDAVAIGHDLARGTSAFRRAGKPETAARTARPEPDWETAAPHTARPAAGPAGLADPTDPADSADPDGRGEPAGPDGQGVAGPGQPEDEPVAVT
ncbi:MULTISPECIES: single-stranded DNA-binding protein [Streptomyces]|uniref:Single-stranded DNA-binding protein n=1 Tax=Streptomyces doudnae TaxID=3075536 RepID=A0ABD5EZ83_9ACTN|nr:MULTISPECIES: single-stranded DNA-binding protein [unclassified Streptomyces]MDT0439975.1 single-stranded DNA-binding protein [Streptomyces sp. DSM 41981]MYQ62304.1 single-stranded DNA-binding protein [Streptomyces sp. SID4950]SCD34741.1 single-strand DNA-binding protein [Streptomyces sp. SolWspMP-5a-2]